MCVCGSVGVGVWEGVGVCVCVCVCVQGDCTIGQTDPGTDFWERAAGEDLKTSSIDVLASP